MDIIFAIIVLTLGLLFLKWAMSLAPWVPTKKEAIKRLSQVIDIKPSENYLELGSWDGRVILSLAEKYPDSYFYWVEIVPYLCFIWRIRQYFLGLKNTKLTLWNALKMNYSHYQHIFIFWLPETIEKKVLPKFESEATIWTKLYSYAFSFPQSVSSQVESLWGPWVQKIHIYTKK